MVIWVHVFHGWARPCQWWWELAGEVGSHLGRSGSRMLGWKTDSLARSKKFRLEVGLGYIPQSPAQRFTSTCHTSCPRGSITSQNTIKNQVFKPWSLGALQNMTGAFHSPELVKSDNVALFCSRGLIRHMSTATLTERNSHPFSPPAGNTKYGMSTL